MNPVREGYPTASTISTTLDKTIVPDPIPADAEKVLPFELAKYERNGYGKWSYGPGLDRVQAARPHAGRLSRRRAHAGRPAPALLRHHRHPHHRRAVSRPSDLLRLQRLPLVGLFGRHDVHAPRPGRGAADGQRHARRGADRLWHLPGRHLQQHPVQRAALVPRRHRRPAHRPRFRRQGRWPPRTSGRVPAPLRGGGSRQVDPLVPGARQSRPLLDGLPGGQRLPAPDLCRRPDPRSRQRLQRPSRSRQPRHLHGLPRRAHAPWRHLRSGTGRRLPHAAESARRRPRPPFAVEERVDGRVLRDLLESAGTRLRPSRRGDRLCLLHLRAQSGGADQGPRAGRHAARRRTVEQRLRARVSRSGTVRLAGGRARQGPGRRQAHDRRGPLPDRRRSARVSHGLGRQRLRLRAGLHGEAPHLSEPHPVDSGASPPQSGHGLEVTRRRPARAGLLADRDLVSAGLPPAVPHLRDRAQQRRHRLDRHHRRRPGGRRRLAGRDLAHLCRGGPAALRQPASVFCRAARTTPSSWYN